MGSKHLGADINLAWPTGSIAVTGPDAAVNIVFRLQIEKAPENRQQLIDDYQERFANPYVPAARGYIDDVIDPRDTRQKIIRALEMLQNKSERAPNKKHGNIPLSRRAGNCRFSAAEPRARGRRCLALLMPAQSG